MAYVQRKSAVFKRGHWNTFCSDRSPVALSAEEYDRLARAFLWPRKRQQRIEEHRALRTRCLGEALRGGLLALQVAFMMVAVGAFVVVVPAFGSTHCHPSRVQQAREDVHRLTLAIEHWKINHEDKPCPETLETLVPEYLSRIPNDPWGENYAYRCPAMSSLGFDLMSKGADRAIDTDDDIRAY